MDNEYLDLVPDRPTPGEMPRGTTNEYDTILQDEERERQSALHISAKRSEQWSPDQFKDILQIANRTELPTELVERNYTSVKPIAERQRMNLDGIARGAPDLAYWLADHKNLTLAKDDLPNLKGQHDLVKEHGLWESAGSSLAAGIFQTGEWAARVPGFLYDAHRAQGFITPEQRMMGVTESDVYGRFTESEIERIKKGEAEMGRRLRENPVAGWMEAGREHYQMPEMSEEVIEHLSNGNMSRAGRVATMQFLQNAPQLFGMLAANFFGQGKPALAAMGIMSASQASKEAQDKGAGAREAVAHGAISGTIEAFAESLGTMKGLDRWGAQITKRFGIETKKQLFRHMATHWLKESGIEGLEEFATSIGQDISGQVTGAEKGPLEPGKMMTKAANAFIGGAIAGGVLGGPMSGMAAYARSQEIATTNRWRDFLGAMGKSVESSKLRERLPEAQREYIERITKDSPVENVYVSVEAFDKHFQGKEDADQIIQSLGINDELARAREFGTDVKIPLAQWMDKLVHTAHHQPLIDDTKYSPNMLSANEHKALMAEFKAQAEAVRDQAEVQRLAQQPFAVPIETLNDPSAVKEGDKVQAVVGGQTVEAKVLGFSPGVSVTLQTEDGQSVEVPNVDLTEFRIYPAQMTPEELQMQPSTDGADAIVAPLMEQLKAGGRFTEDEVGAYANEYKARLRGMAQRAGLTPDEFARRFPVEVGAIETAHNEALEQRERRLFQSIRPRHKVKRSLSDGSISVSVEGRGEASGDMMSSDSFEFWFEGNARAADQVPYDEIAILEHVEVNPGSRREGVGQSLVRAFVDKAKGAGAEAVFLNASPVGSNKVSVDALKAFYTSLGFKVWEDMKTNVIMYLDTAKHRLEPMAGPAGVSVVPRAEMPDSVEISILDPNPKALPAGDDIEALAVAAKQHVKAKLQPKKAGFKNNHRGWNVQIPKKGVSKIAAADVTREHFVAMVNLDKLLERAIHVWTEPPDRAGILHSHILIAPIEIDGRSFDVRLRVNETNTGEKLYFQHVIESERPAAYNREAAAKDSEQAPRSSGSIPYSIDDFLPSINSLIPAKPKRKQSFDQAAPAASPAPAFYSKLTRLIEDKMGGAAKPAEILALIKEIKEEERKWSGIDEFLKGKEKVTKAELLDFLRANQLEIKEVTKAEIKTTFTDWMAERYGDRWLDFSDDRMHEEKESFKEQVPESAVPKFAQYTLPGGEKYREILFTLPLNISNLPDGYRIEEHPTNKHPWRVIDSEGQIAGFGLTKDEALKDYASVSSNNVYRSSHFDEKNIVAHTRLNDRVDADGKRVLFVEEIQSDWHQAGRKKGYKGESASEDLAVAAQNAEDRRETAGRILKTEIQKIDSLGFDSYAQARMEIESRDFDKTAWDLTPESEKAIDEYRAALAEQSQTALALAKAQAAVPDAPFKKTWHEFVLKRLIRMAAEQGYDRIAWTTGEQQAERFDLSKQVDKVQYFKEGDAYRLGVYATGSGLPMALPKQVYAADELGDVVGKELAEKIVSGTGKTLGDGSKQLSGLDLKVGGEGMKGFYDKIIPDYLRKFGKKYGATVGSTQLVGEDVDVELYPWQDDDSGQWFIRDKGYNDQIAFEEQFESEQDAKSFIRKNSGSGGFKYTDVHSLDITPALKDAALTEGFTLFQGEAPRGQVRIDRNKYEIAFGSKRDLSTWLHENGHVWLDIMESMSGQNPAIADDYGKITSWWAEKADHVLQVVDEQISRNEAQLQRWIERDTNKDEVESFRAHIENTKRLRALVQERGGADFVREVAKNRNGQADEAGEFIAVQLHEYMARGFEAYIFEGKAPKPELEGVFARLRDWLVKIYENIKNLDVELTDDVRQVMDRLYTTDQAVGTAIEVQGISPLLGKNPHTMGLTGDRAVRYLKAVADAEAQAKDMLNERLMKDLKRKQKKQYKEARKRILEEVTKEVDAEKVYATIALMKADATKRIARSDVIELMGPEALNALPAKTTSSKNDETMPIALVAELFGFESGTDLIEQLGAAPKRADLIEHRVEERMLEKHPDLLQDPRLPIEAMKAIHNEKRSELLRLELEILMAEKLPVFKDVVRQTSKPLPTDEEIRKMAAEIIGGQNIKLINPLLYQRAEAKAAKEATQAMLKGDLDGAYEAKRRELLNHELYRAAVEARENHQKAIALFDKFGDSDEKLSKLRNIDLINTGRSILAQFGMGESDIAPLAHLEQMKEYDPDTYGAILHLVTSLTQNGIKHHSLLTYDDFVALQETIDGIWKMARAAKAFELEGKKLDKDLVVEELTDRIQQLDNNKGERAGYDRTATEWDKWKQGILGWKAMLTRVESWVEVMDGAAGGPFRRYIWEPITKATTNYQLAKKPVVTKYRDLLKSIEPSLQRKGEIVAPELNGYKFRTKADLLGAMLHTGNDSNLQKLLIGREWGEFDATGNLSTFRWTNFVTRMWKEGVLTKADYDFLQGVWDLNESLKPEAQRVHKKLYGRYFSEITANSFRTPFGEYRGGYVPAVTDPFIVDDALTNQQRDELLNNANSFMFPTSGRGFTKSRVQMYNRPLLMELALVGGHIDKVLRFIHIEPATKQVAGLIMDRSFKRVLSRFDQTIQSDMLVPWLQRAAQQSVSTPGLTVGGKRADRVLSALRSRIGLQAMTANVVNTLQNIPGLVLAMTIVKPRFMRNALWRYVRNPRGRTAEIAERSEYMRAKFDEETQKMAGEIHTLIEQPDKVQEFSEFAQRTGYFMQSAVQNILDGIVWNAAYEQALEGRRSEAEAVRLADSAVRRTQGSLRPEDISAFESGGSFKRLFTMFYSYFNMQANLNATELQKTFRDFGLKKGAGRLMYIYCFGFMAPAVLAELIVRAMNGKIDEDDDDEYLDDFMMVFFGSQFRTMTAMIPYVGHVAQGVWNMSNDKAYDDRITVSPAIAVLERAAKTPFTVGQAISEGRGRKNAIRDTLTLMGLLTGLPLGPLGRPAGYLVDIAEGKVEPEGPIDLTRGLITGKSGQ